MIQAKHQLSSSLPRVAVSLLLVAGILTIIFTSFEKVNFHRSPSPKARFTVPQIISTYSYGLQNSYSVKNVLPFNTTKKSNLKCIPVHKIVFLKTYKTASTTTASIFERFGYYRGLKFAVGRSHVLSRDKHFHRRNVLKFPLMKGTFDILCNHARYQKKEMDIVVPNAAYITILRKPEDQLESAFGYFEMYKGMNLSKDKNAFKTFMSDPLKYFNLFKYTCRQISRNGQLFALGFDHKNDDNETEIVSKIAQLDRDFDLVMLTEYYDESLILLKRLLCWDYEDILYFSIGARSDSHRTTKDKDLIDKARKWNHGDVLLHEHFTKIFWRKVVEYGPSFGEHLQKFRKLNRAAFDECINLHETNKTDRRVFELVLKNKTDRCQRILRGDVGYTNLIRTSMLKRYAFPAFGKEKTD